MQSGNRRWWKRSRDKSAGAAKWQVRPATGRVHFDPALRTAAQLAAERPEPHQAA